MFERVLIDTVGLYLLEIMFTIKEVIQHCLLPQHVRLMYPISRALKRLIDNYYRKEVKFHPVVVMKPRLSVRTEY